MAAQPETELGRRVLARTFFLTSDASSRVKIPSNRRRVGLLIGNNSGAAWFLNFTDQPAAGQGVPIPTGTNPILLEGMTWGDSLTGEIWIIMGGAGVVGWFTELVQAP